MVTRHVKSANVVEEMHLAPELGKTITVCNTIKELLVRCQRVTKILREGRLNRASG